MADPRVSWTGFLIASVARAVSAHPEVNTRKAGNHVLSFDRVDIGATVERHWQGRTVLDFVVVTDADLKSCAEVTDMLHRAKYGPGQPHRPSGLTAQLVRLPGPLRRAAIRAAGSSPGVAATFGPAVGVTSIGMFSDGWGWAIPLAPLTLIVRRRGRGRTRAARTALPPPRRGGRAPTRDASSRDGQLRAAVAEYNRMASLEVRTCW